MKLSLIPSNDGWAVHVVGTITPKDVRRIWDFGSHCGAYGRNDYKVKPDTLIIALGGGDFQRMTFAELMEVVTKLHDA